MLAYNVIMIVCAAGAVVVDAVATSIAGVASAANAMATITAATAFSLDCSVSKLLSAQTAERSDANGSRSSPSE